MPPTGTVQVLEDDTVLAETQVRRHGGAFVWIDAEALDAGRHELTVRYLGNDEVAASATTMTVRVFGFGW